MAEMEVIEETVSLPNDKFLILNTADNTGEKTEGMIT